MTQQEFATWMAKYRKQFLRPDEEYDFVLGWEQALIGQDFRDCCGAIVDLAATGGEQVSWPRTHLPLLLDRIGRLRGMRQFDERQTPAADDRSGLNSAAWDHHMLRHGRITPAEASRREEERRQGQQQPLAARA